MQIEALLGILQASIDSSERLLLVTVTIVTATHNLVFGAQPRLEGEALSSAGRLLLTVAAAIIMSALQRLIGH
jgi:hypothetical protein